MKVVFILALVLLCSQLMCQVNLIDSLACIATNAGNLTFDENNIVYWINTGSQFTIGDGWDWFQMCKYASFTYFSFPVEPVMAGYHTVGATLFFYVMYIMGNSQLNAYPVFEMPWGTEIPDCQLSHVIYGNTLEASDLNVPDLQPPVNVFNSFIPGWNSLEITDFYLDDYNNDRILSQYILKLQFVSDWDYLDDYIVITGASSNGYNPFLLIEYAPDSTAIDDNYISPTPEILAAYPNPFSDKLFINIYLKSGTLVTTEIFNIKGHLIKKTILTGNKGQNTFTWDGTDKTGKSAKPGVYLVRIQHNNITMQKKITKLR